MSTLVLPGNAHETRTVQDHLDAEGQEQNIRRVTSRREDVEEAVRAGSDSRQLQRVHSK